MMVFLCLGMVDVVVSCMAERVNIIQKICILDVAMSAWAWVTIWQIHI